MKALLALEDGFVLEGRSFTGPCEGGGEVIFNTGMTGYQEILTDPSYYGQMVCMTWPLIGNYGISAEDMESGKVHAAALIVKECCKTPSNWRSVCSLPDFLQQHGVPGIEGIDTRALTRHLRMHGAMRGMVSTSITDPAELVMQAKSLPSMEGQNLVTPRDARYAVEVDRQRRRPRRTQRRRLLQLAGRRPAPRRLRLRHQVEHPAPSDRAGLRRTGRSAVLHRRTGQGQRRSGRVPVQRPRRPGDPHRRNRDHQEACRSYPVAGICLAISSRHALGGTTRKLKFGHPKLLDEEISERRKAIHEFLMLNHTDEEVRE